MSRGWQDVPLPEGMDPQIMIWRWFAKTYHWDVDQVENAPIEVQHWFPLIEDAAHEAHEFLAKQEMNSAKAGPRKR